MNDHPATDSQLQASQKQLNTYRFHYSMAFEVGMTEALGHQAYQSASQAGTPELAKRVMLKALDRLEKRADVLLTMDERLKDRLSDNFEALRKHLKTIDTSFNEMDIISTFFQIVSRLLGYDWQEGKAYRTPVYFQTKQQLLSNYENRFVADWRQGEASRAMVGLTRCKVAHQLSQQGLHNNQIARVLNTTDYSVWQMLQASLLDRIDQLLKSGLDLIHIQYQLEHEGHEPNEVSEMLNLLRRLGSPNAADTSAGSPGTG